MVFSAAPGTWLEIRRETGGAPLHGVVGVARGPCEAFGAEHPREGVSTQHARQTLGVEGPVGSVDEAGDAIPSAFFLMSLGGGT